MKGSRRRRAIYVRRGPSATTRALVSVATSMIRRGPARVLGIASDPSAHPTRYIRPVTDAARLPDFTLRLPEQLMLVALRPNGSMNRRQEMRFGLAGAAFLELLIAERVELRGRQAHVVRDEPLGHPTCDLVLAAMAESRSDKPTTTWLHRFEKKVVEPTGEVLVHAGLATRKSRLEVGPVRWTAYVPTSGEEAARLRQSVGIALTDGVSDARTTALALLLDAVHLLRDHMPSLDRAERTRRLGELTAASYNGADLQTAIAALKHEIESAEGAAA